MYFSRRYLLAVVAMMALAAPALADALDDGLASAKAMLLSGDSDVAADKLDALQLSARQAVALKPDDAHAQYILGMASMYTGDDTQALRSLDLAVRMEPKNPVFVFGRADLSLYQNQPGEAAVILQRYLETDAKNAEAWDKLGSAQSQTHQYDPALKSFQKAADLAPREPKYVARIAETLEAEGKEDLAIAAYQKMLLIDPKYAIGLASLGEIYQNRKEYPKALDIFTQAVASDPADYRSTARQVQIYETLGQTKERDAAIATIHALHASGKMDVSSFCREQFTSGKSTVMAFEYIDSKSPRALLYTFTVLAADGKTVASRIALASYDNVNNLAIRNGTIKSGEHIYHLDVDTTTTHETLGMFKIAPSYEQCRQMARDVLDKKFTAPAGMIPFPAGAQ